jgi:hypothetical protein
MTIYATHTTFRRRFAVLGTTTGVSLTFVAPDTINGSGFDVAGHLVGHTLDVVGTASNDGRRGTIATVSAGTITLALTGTDLTAEGPISADLSSAFIDPGGFERWPVDLVDHPPASQLTGASTSYAGTALTISINAGAADAAPGVDEADWYVSQRTDTPANQYLAVTQTPPSGGDTFSGSIDIVHTTLAETEFGLAVGVRPSPDALINLFRRVAVYGRLRSGGAIKWVDLLAAQTTQTAA